MLGPQKSLRPSSAGLDIERERWAIALALRCSCGHEVMARTCPPAAFTSSVRSALYQSVVFGRRSIIELNREYRGLQRYQPELETLTRYWRIIGDHCLTDTLSEAIHLLITISKIHGSKSKL